MQVYTSLLLASLAGAALCGCIALTAVTLPVKAGTTAVKVGVGVGKAAVKAGGAVADAVIPDDDAAAE